MEIERIMRPDLNQTQFIITIEAGDFDYSGSAIHAAEAAIDANNVKVSDIIGLLHDLALALERAEEAKKAQSRAEMAVGPTEHDYTKRYWGHDFTFRAVDGTRGEMSGWGMGIEKGDFLILPNGYETTRYIVDEIEYCSDPADMWHAKVTFAPRKKP